MKIKISEVDKFFLIFFIGILYIGIVVACEEYEQHQIQQLKEQLR